MLNKTGKPFLYKTWGYQQKGRPQKNVQPYGPYQQKQIKYRFNKNTYVKSLTPDFQVHVSELVNKMKFLNEKSKTGGISEHINNQRGRTFDKWILKTIRGADIEIDDLEQVPFSNLSGGKLLSLTETTSFGIEIKRLLEKCVLRPEKCILRSKN